MSGETSPIAIVVTGPECTGKTTLAERLTEAYDTPHSPEFARAYATHHADLGPDDVSPIARGQIAGEDAAAAAAVARGRALVVRDTDLVSTVVYARHYYGACPPWIEEAARARRGALYLLCTPDIPWIADGVRDRPHARDTMLDAFRSALIELACPYVEVRGDWHTREATARAAIHDHVASLGILESNPVNPENPVILSVLAVRTD